MTVKQGTLTILQMLFKSALETLRDGMCSISAHLDEVYLLTFE